MENNPAGKLDMASTESPPSTSRPAVSDSLDGMELPTTTRTPESTMDATDGIGTAKQDMPVTAPLLPSPLLAIDQEISRHGIDEIREVVQILQRAEIPCCVVHNNALQYYGAGRLATTWDLTVPTALLRTATVLFTSPPSSSLYIPSPPPVPNPKSLRHVSQTFSLCASPSFTFLLTPTAHTFIDPSLPNTTETSRRSGIPYASMPALARALLVLQNASDLADFVDGMDLDEAWGEAHIDFDALQEEGWAFTRDFNAELRRAQAQGGERFFLGDLREGVDYRERWNWCVGRKEKRIEPMKKGRYKTQWRRIKNDSDPREREDRPY